MSCKYNNCKVCGYKKDCTILQENAELKRRNKQILKYTLIDIEIRDKLIHKAKRLLEQWLQTTKSGGCDNIAIVKDTKAFIE